MQDGQQAAGVAATNANLARSNGATDQTGADKVAHAAQPSCGDAAITEKRCPLEDIGLITKSKPYKRNACDLT